VDPQLDHAITNGRPVAEIIGLDLTKTHEYPRRGSFVAKSR
jgi:hypothetical protein